jgi:hypothetical protein
MRSAGTTTTSPPGKHRQSIERPIPEIVVVTQCVKRLEQ